MAIVLQILKVIGIILLVILSVLLLVVALVLFVPFRYRVRTGKEEEITADVRVSWLLHFIRVDVLYQKEVNIKAAVLGITVFDKKKREEKKRKKEAAAADKTGGKKDKCRKNKDKDNKEDTEAEDISEEVGAGSSNPRKDESKAASGTEDGDTSKTEDKNKKDNKNNKKRKSHFFAKKKITFAEWIDAQLDKLAALSDRIADKIDSFADHTEEMIDKAVDTYIYYDKLLFSKGTEWVIEYGKKHTIPILKDICPRKVSGDLYFHSDDPAKAAKLWEFYALATPLLDRLPGKIDLTSDMEDEKMTFHLTVKGRVFLFVVAWHGLLLILNKKVRRFIKLLKREDV